MMMEGEKEMWKMLERVALTCECERPLKISSPVLYHPLHNAAETRSRGKEATASSRNL